MKQILILFFISLIPFFSFAQISILDKENLYNKFPNQDAIFLNISDHINIDFDKNGIVIEDNHSETMLFLTNNTQYYTDQYVFFSSLSTIQNLRAFHHSYIEGKYKTTEVNETVTQNRYSTSVFYDDNKLTKVLFPKAEKFDQNEVSYTEITRDAHLMSAFYMASYLPTKQITVSISFPETVKLLYKVFNDPEHKIKFTKTTDKNKTTYKWVMEYADKYPDDESFSISYFTPHIAIYIDEYTYKGKTVKVNSDVDALYSWYATLTKNLNKDDSDELKKLADSLTRDKNTELEKIKAIYYWVQENINYVAFEDGYSGFIPREAKDILHKRYGDCKDMSSIMKELFSYTDIPAHLTWIGTRDIPYTYNELPTLSSDNHMIVAVEVKDSIIFLEGTASFLSIDVPSSFIQGKQALVGIDSSTYKLITVPEISKDKNIIVDSCTLTIDSDIIKGYSRLSADGYFHYDITSRLKRKPVSEYKKYFSDFLETGSNKFSLDSFNIINPIDRDIPFKMDYYYSIPDYLKKIGDTYYINLHLDKPLRKSSIDTLKQQFDSKRSYKTTQRYITKLEIPTGYIIESLPENASFSNPLFGFNIKYSQSKDKKHIILFKEVYVDTLTIPVEEFNNWNDMIKQLNKAYKQAIKLKR